MASLREFLAMGGYAVYVWPAFACAAIALGGVMLWSSVEFRRVRAETFRRARVGRRPSRGGERT